MPSRGQYWKKGGLIDETVKEEDLSQALQAKVNSSGGYDSISDEGGEILPQRIEINFTGDGVTATDAGGRTVVTIPSGGGHIIEDEGTPLATQPDLNFVGAGVTATNDGENTATVITIPIQPAYATIQDEGSPLTQRSALNFTGAGVTAFDDGENTLTQIDFPHDGRLEKLGSTSIGAEGQTIVVALSNVSSTLYSEIIAYAEVGCVSTASTIGWQINGETTGYSQDVFSWDNTAVTAGGNASAISFGIPGATIGLAVNSTLRMTELRNGIKTVQIKTNSQTSNPAINYGQLSGTSSSISSITMNGLTTDFQAGSKVTIYGVKIN